MGNLESHSPQWVQTAKFHAAATSENQALSFRGEKTLTWIRYFENRYSRYLPNSLISEINNSAGIEPVKIIEREDYRLFNLCNTLHFLTKGILIYSLPLSKIWDF